MLTKKQCLVNYINVSFTRLNVLKGRIAYVLLQNEGVRTMITVKISNRPTSINNDKKSLPKLVSPA